MELQILNFESGLDMMGDDKELYKELIEEFINSNKYDAQEIQHLIKTGNAQVAGSKIHKIKGAAAAIGAELLQEICSKAERILRGKEEGDATPLLPLIEERYRDLQPELQNALQKLS